MTYIEERCTGRESKYSNGAADAAIRECFRKRLTENSTVTTVNVFVGL